MAVVGPLSQVMRFARCYHRREAGYSAVALSAYHSLGSFGLKVVACLPDFPPTFVTFPDFLHSTLLP